MSSVTQRLELRLTEILVDDGVITLESVLDAIREAAKSGESLVDVLVRQGAITDEQLAHASDQMVLESEDTMAIRVPGGSTAPWAKLFTSGSNKGEVTEESLPLTGLGTRARYRDAGTLGQGGMAVVTLADDRLLNRQVALKALPEGRAPGRAGERLLEEARVTGLLDHPGIVPGFPGSLDHLCECCPCIGVDPV